MRVLVITQFFFPEFGAASARITGLARKLKEGGIEMGIVTCYPNYPYGKVYSDYDCQPLERQWGMNIYRVWTYIRPKNTSLYRIINFISFFIMSTIRGYKIAKHYDIILVSSPPLIVGLSGLLLSKRYRIKCVFDIRDIWPDVAIEAGEYRTTDFIVRFASWIAQAIYTHSDHITVVTTSKRRKLLAKKIPARKLSIVENGIDSEIINNSDKVDTKDVFAIDNDKILCIYAGLIGVAQGVMRIVEMAETPLGKAFFHFLIIGEGSDKKIIEAYISQKNISNVSVKPAVIKKEVIGFIKGSDIAVVTLANAQIKDAIPSKLLEAWACQKPVIFIGGGESAELVNHVGGGVNATPNELQEMVNCLSLLQDCEVRKEMGKRGYHYVTKYLTRSILANKMRIVFDQLTHNKR